MERERERDVIRKGWRERERCNKKGMERERERDVIRKRWREREREM